MTRFVAFLWLLWLGLLYEVIFDNSSRLGKHFDNPDAFSDGVTILSLILAALLLGTLMALSPANKSQGNSSKDAEGLQPENTHKEA